ncbi:MAG: carboxypeptidase-like regulatory domain-containing protein [Patescibacteria group bacterium]
MREHPIPQDVTGYKFHIIGNMTLKQFAEIFIGAIIAIAIYNFDITNLIKYPLMLFFFALGAAAAFVPIEERPLDHWILTFIKTMYRPTKFFWRRKPKIPEPFLYKQTEQETELYNEVDMTPTRRKRIQEYLTSVNEKQPDEWELFENQRINEVMSSFATIQVNQSNISIKKDLTKKPNLQIAPRSIRGYQYQESVVFDQNQPVYQESQFDQLSLNHSSDESPSRDFAIPENPAIEVVTDQRKQFNVPQESSVLSSDMAFSSLESTQQNYEPTQAVKTNINLPFPKKPTEINKIVGMVLTPNNNLITNAIVEIRNQKGQIVRAVKTNALGQFFVATPLDDGSYVISAEKSDYQFEDQKLSLASSLVEPIEIRSLNN